MKLKTKAYGLALIASILAGCSSAAVPSFAPSFDKKNASYLTQPVAMVTATEDQLQPSISKNNHHLVYAARVAGNLDIYLKSASEAAAAERLTEHSTDDTSPVFSPDGQSIVWVSKRADVKGDLWIMNRSGGKQRQLTTRSTADSNAMGSPS